MKKLNLIRAGLLVLLVAVFVLFLFIAYNDYQQMQVIYYDTYGIVGDRIGFDTDDERISFGMIMTGGAALRKVKITNGPVPKEGYVHVRGDITPWFQVDESPFSLEPYENKTLHVSFFAPRGQEPTTFTGEVKIVLKGKR